MNKGEDNFGITSDFFKDPITNGGQLYKKKFLVLKNCFNDKLHVDYIHFWLICINF